MRDVMLDLETFGLKPGHIIRSIGAVEFDITTGKFGDEFYTNIEELSCGTIGLTRDAGTVTWWNKPENASAQEQLLIDALPVDIVCKKFCDFFRSTGAQFIWSQGSNFDGVLLAEVMDRVGCPTPWKYHSALDTRTAYRMAKFDPWAVKRDGVHHNALDDAKHQAYCVHQSWLKIHGDKP